MRNRAEEKTCCLFCRTEDQLTVAAVMVVNEDPCCLRHGRRETAHELRPTNEVAPSSVKTMALADYHAAFGPPHQGKGFLPENLELWQKLKALPFDAVLVVPAKTETSDLTRQRVGLTNCLSRLARQQRAEFTVHVAVNTLARHVVLWKKKKKGE
jgi:hypothetical protein